MKKLINDPLNVVREMLEGVVAVAPGLAMLADENVVVDRDADISRVALLSGGGSGHEPAHAGYVGSGMLTAAVAGDVFTSPSSDAVLAGLRAVGGKAGALLIVKNYTGDRLNFGLAAEMAAAEGIPTAVVVVADDVSLRNTVEEARRRGVAGTVFVHKVAGAAAAEGRSLDDVARVAEAAARDIGTMGVALGACTLPAVGRPGFTLGNDEIELGLGIHGEQGVERTSMQSVDDLVERIVGTIVEDKGLGGGDRVALLVNGLGATPPMELAIALRGTLRSLRSRGIDVVRAWSGTFLSALDMPGFSVSVMRVDEDRLRLLDAYTAAPAWPGGGLVNVEPVLAASVPAESISKEDAPSASLLSDRGRRLRDAAHAAARSLMDGEAALTDLDTRTGDGDLGSSMVRGASAVLALPDHAWRSDETALACIGDALRRAIAGSSGPFYATALLRASRSLSGERDPGPSAWADAFVAAVDKVAELGGAKPGDRTMVDALYPASQRFRNDVLAGLPVTQAWANAVRAAKDGADATASMKPRLGRASYLGERAVGVPDGGAVAVTYWIEALRPFVV